MNDAERQPVTSEALAEHRRRLNAKYESEIVRVPDGRMVMLGGADLIQHGGKPRLRRASGGPEHLLAKQLVQKVRKASGKRTHRRTVHRRAPGPPIPRTSVPGYVNEQTAARELGCTVSELSARTKDVSKVNSPSGVLFSLSQLEEKAVTSKAESQRRDFVSLDDAAESLDLHPEDLAAAVTGRVTMRAVGKSLELDAAELRSAIPKLKTRGLLRPTPKAPREPRGSQVGVYSANRQRRTRIGAPQRWTARPWRA